MNVLLVHNFYRHPGGEDIVFAAEDALLREKGNTVSLFTDQNDRISGMSNLSVAATAVWSRSSRERLQGILLGRRFDVAHFHNTHFMISPSAYYACRRARVPVVQTLHNYRLLCSAATLFRDGQICEECLGTTLRIPAIRHACYRGSRGSSALVAGMTVAHRFLGTWDDRVDAYIAPSDFVRRKFVDAGFDADRLFVKPNFISPDPGKGSDRARFGLFVGRLTAEKGIMNLLEAWQQLDDIPLKVVGNGILEETVRSFIQQHKMDETIGLMGWLPRERMLEIMKRAAFLIFPSHWYEVFPLTVIEAFACGLPVIATRIGVLREMIRDGHTGLHCEPGSSDGMAARIRWAFDHPEEMAVMGAAGRREYELKYTADQNYRILHDIYQHAVHAGKNGHETGISS